MKQKHSKLLKASRLPWYIPRWLGGLGLPLPHGEELSKTDLKIAKAIIMGWKENRPVSLSTGNLNQWKVRDRSQKVVKGREVQGLSDRLDPLVKNYERFVGRQTINLMLTSGVNLDDLFDSDPQTGRSGAALRRNRELWDPSKRKDTRPLNGPIDSRVLDLAERGETGLRTMELDTFGLPRGGSFFQVSAARRAKELEAFGQSRVQLEKVLKYGPSGRRVGQSRVRSLKEISQNLVVADLLD